MARIFSTSGRSARIHTLVLRRGRANCAQPRQKPHTSKRARICRPAQLKEQLRGRVSDVVSCDLFNREKGKFLPEKHDREGVYDVVVTSMLLEAVIQDLDTYARVIKRHSSFFLFLSLSNGRCMRNVGMAI
ncbi:hypothetical protein HPB49_025798 [Dermacentor silvarum]|nr:hypothetical protein HPB49_025798 [Dermacentor silvarum]